MTLLIPLSRSSQVMNSLFFMVLFAVGASVANSQYMGFGGNVILCWRCEEAECNKYFDFTQHAAEQCDGKCWKSYDVVQVKSRKEQEESVEMPASRRCFTSDELMKANAIGVNTANGCRDIKMRDRTKHFCFCDGDMCNGARLTTRPGLWFMPLTFFATVLFYLF